MYKLKIYGKELVEKLLNKTLAIFLNTFYNIKSER